MENNFKNSLKNKLIKNISNHGNVALELKIAKEKLITSIQNYNEKFDYLISIEKPNFEDIMKETDAWGELFNNILYYTEVKLEMHFKSDIEKMFLSLKNKTGVKND